MSELGARRRRRRRAHPHLHEHTGRGARGAPAREAVRADPEQPVHRVPVPAQPGAAGRGRHDRALHGRLGRPVGRDQRVHRAVPEAARAGALGHGHASRERRRALFAGRRRAAHRDPAATRLAARRVRRDHGPPALLSQRARHADRRGDAPARSFVAPRRDRRFRTGTRRDRRPHSSGRPAQRARRRIHPRRRSGRLLPRRRRVRAPDPHGRRLRPRARWRRRRRAFRDRNRFGAPREIIDDGKTGRARRPGRAGRARGHDRPPARLARPARRR